MKILLQVLRNKKIIIMMKSQGSDTKKINLI